MASVTLMPTVKPKKDYIWPRSVRSGARSRAWCLEEYLLSPRKPIYGEIDSRWSCQALSYKPHYPKDVDRRNNPFIASWDTVSSDYKTEAQKAKRSVKHGNFFSFRPASPFDSIFRVEINSEVDGILRINAAIFPVTGLRENLHITSDMNAPDTYQDCSLLCFNYFCHTDYIGLMVRPKREERCGSK